MKCYKVGLSVN